MDKTCNLWICVDKCLLDLEVCSQVLTYLSPCYDKTESFTALPPGLELHLCCCTISKSL